AHTLVILGRDRMWAGLTHEEMERWLNAWLSQYIPPAWASSPDEPPIVAYYRQALGRARNGAPLAEGRVEVMEVRGKPGFSEIVAWLRPSYQIEETAPTLRAVGELVRDLK